MPFNDKCSICTAPNCDELEQLGLRAANGEISWRQAAREGALNHFGKLQNHMNRHYESPSAAIGVAVDEEFMVEVRRTEQELLRLTRTAAPEVRPLYLTAIRNLKSLMETKPSQQQLITALKTIHEITGMKMEQRLLLDFARHAFKGSPRPVSAPEPKALSATDIAGQMAVRALEGADIVDAEVVE